MKSSVVPQRPPQVKGWVKVRVANKLTFFVFKSLQRYIYIIPKFG